MRNLQGFRLIPVIGCLGIWATAPAQAQPVPRVNSLSTTWFQRGTTNELTITGENIPAGATLQFSGRGLAGTVVVATSTNLTLEGSGTGLTATPPPPSTKSAQVRLVVEADAPLGTQDLRILGPTGMSNGQGINISDLREIREQTPSASAEQPQWLPLPAAISGAISKAAESDYFKFQGRPGERLIFDVQANRLGSPLDASLVIQDASGKEVARNDDGHGLDPFLEFVPPAEGEYRVKLNDLRFQGGEGYRYRMVAGALPYLERIFPFAGRRGTTVDLRLAGVNLEGADRLSLRIDPDAPTGRQDVRARTVAGFSNPLPFEPSDLPDTLESEPNNTREQANTLTLPIAVNARIEGANDVDVYRFKPERDQRLVVEVQARRFGSPLDALITIMEPSGNILQRNDDGAGGMDARVEADFKGGQEYRVSVRDLTDRGGPAFGYRLTLQAPDRTPDYSVSAAAGRVRVHAGGHTAVRVEVARRHGFDGIVTVTAEDLPPGVSASRVVLDPRGAEFGWLVLGADAITKTGTSPLSLVAIGEHGGRPVVRRVNLPETGFLTLLPAAPFNVTAAESSLAVEQAGNTGIEVAIQRREGFDGEVKIIAEDLAGIGQPSLTLPGSQARGRMVLNPGYNAPPGVRPLMLRAEAKVDGENVVEYAPAPVWITVQGIPLFITAMLPGSPFFRTDPVRLAAVALPNGTKSEANRTEFVVKVERRGFAGDIPLSVDGLPAGVTASHGMIVSNLSEASIKLVVGEKTELKEHSFTVLASVTNSDRIIRQRTQPVTLTAQAPEKELAASSPTNTPPADK